MGESSNKFSYAKLIHKFQKALKRPTEELINTLQAMFPQRNTMKVRIISDNFPELTHQAVMQMLEREFNIPNGKAPLYRAISAYHILLDKKYANNFLERSTASVTLQGVTIKTTHWKRTREEKIIDEVDYIKTPKESKTNPIKYKLRVAGYLGTEPLLEKALNKLGKMKYIKFMETQGYKNGCVEAGYETLLYQDILNIQKIPLGRNHLIHLKWFTDPSVIINEEEEEEEKDEEVESFTELNNLSSAFAPTITNQNPPPTEEPSNANNTTTTNTLNTASDEKIPTEKENKKESLKKKEEKSPNERKTKRSQKDKEGKRFSKHRSSIETLRENAKATDSSQ